MRTIKYLLIFLALLTLSLAVFFVFQGENVQVFQPKGMIAKKQLDLILVNLTLMHIILVPTFFWILFVVWKYRSHGKNKYEGEKQYGKVNQAILWTLPSLIVLVMAIHTWKETHLLDPYRRFAPKEEELLIQVVALDWKWLFIYPEAEIATVNFVQFPEKKAIRFELTADGSPMNSFWIPQLAGQIYCMTGMVTPLHLEAGGVGIYPGRAAEINGEGYAKMTFVAKSTTENDYHDWVETIKKSALQLEYSELRKPSIDHPIQFYSNVEKDLFETIVMKEHHHE